MNIEQYCIENNKPELLQQFMSDIDPIANMGGPETAIYAKYDDTKFLFNFKCHACTTEWSGSPYSYIVKGYFCPKCNDNSDLIKIKYASRGKGQITLDEYCNDYKEQGLQLKAEWLGKNESGDPVEMYQYSYSSNDKVYWKCIDCGHEWVATISHRTSETFRRGCPICGKETAAKNRVATAAENYSLKKWCDENGAKGQQVAESWTGIDEDGNTFSMDDVPYASNKRMQWKCPEYGHEWIARIADRTCGSGCPYCSGYRASELNSLLTYCNKNGAWGQRLKAEWTGIDSEGNKISMEEISYGSHQNVQWKCPDCGHKWNASINDRTTHESGCPICGRKSAAKKIRAKAAENFSLKAWCPNNGEWGKHIEKEWTGLDEEGNTISMEEISYGSNKKVQWECIECNHKWVATIANRTQNKSECPYCSGKRVSEQNSLLTYCNKNGAWGKRLMKEWKGIDSEGNKISMEDVSYASHQNVQWQCESCKHIWNAEVAYRTFRKCGCPKCSTKSTSYPEQFIYWSFKQLYPDTKNRYLTFQSEQNPKGVEYDVAIKDIPLYIEYSPTYWHKGKEERDNYKKQLCEQHNIRFIKIIEDNYNEYEKKFTRDYICIPTLYASNREDYLIKIVSYILNSINHNINEIDIETVKNNALKYSTGSIEYEKSLEYIHPALVKEWHPTLNSIQPSKITPGSRIKAYWQCINCNYGRDGEWEKTINERTNNKRGCPKCGYNWFDGKIHSMAVKVTTEGINDLQSQHPELAKEWNLTMNNISPSEVKCGSGKNIYWQCTNCGYGKDGEWKTTPVSRISHNGGCPHCGYNWYKAETGQPQKIKPDYKYSKIVQEMLKKR